VSDPGKLAGVLSRAFTANAPRLIEVMIDGTV
jgi:hypothetical protein